jgi:nucleoside-diphosphate-sugar epimerase
VTDNPAGFLEPPALTVLTGASGWFGRAYLRGIAQGCEGTDWLQHSGAVRVLVPTPAEVPPVLEALPRARVYVGDVTDEGTVARLLHDARGASIVHAAGIIHPRRVEEFDRVNVVGTSVMLEAARRAGVRRFVHLSSNSPFGTNATPTDTFRHDEPYDPYMNYGRSKMEAELAVRAMQVEGGLDTVILRPPWFYGPYQPPRQTTFFSMVRSGRFPLVGSGAQQRSMVYVDNLVQGVARAQRVEAASGCAFWIADARPYSMREILVTVRQALREEGLRVSSRQISLPSTVGRIAEALDRRLQGRGLYQRELHVLGEMDKTIACDIGRTREVLGYRPTVDLAEGMRRSIRWCLAAGLEI